MKVENFENFSGKIFEDGATGPAQNTPSKSGNDYKVNMGYKAVDSNKETASNLVIFAIEGVGAIISMANLLSGYFESVSIARQRINTDMAGKMSSDAFISKRNSKGEVSVDKDEASQMIENYFNTMKSTADEIYAKGEENAGGSGDRENALKAYHEALAKIVEDAKKRTNNDNGAGVAQITRNIESPYISKKSGIDKTHGYDEIFATEKKNLDKALKKELDKSNIVTYNTKMKAAQYYKAAVYAFAQGGLVELKGLEEELQSKEGKSYFVDAVEKLGNIGYEIYNNEGRVK
jgi:hypothetical protein